MSICIISDHFAKTKFHYNTQHIDQVKPKYEGGASAPKTPPGSAPGTIARCSLGYWYLELNTATQSTTSPRTSRTTFYLS